MSYSWQSPSQRKRAMLLARERQKSKGRKRLKLQRVRAELKIVDKLETSVTEARVVLTDITPQGLGLFATMPLPVGQEVALTLEQPKRFYVRARVTACLEHDVESHVMTHDRYSFRISVEFVFATAAERAEVEKYCDTLKKDHLYGASFAQHAA